MERVLGQRVILEKGLIDAQCPAFKLARFVLVRRIEGKRRRRNQQPQTDHGWNETSHCYRAAGARLAGADWYSSMICLMRWASLLRWPWLASGSAPPVDSISISDQNMPVLMWT